MQNWVLNRSEVEKFKTIDLSTLNRGVPIPYLFQNIVKFFESNYVLLIFLPAFAAYLEPL